MVPPKPSKLIEALDEVELILRKRRYVQVNGGERCQAYHDPMAEPHRIVLAMKHPKIRSADDLVLNTIHELIHHIGYDEKGAYGMEKAYYSSAKLREAILKRFVDVGLLGLTQWEKG